MRATILGGLLALLALPASADPVLEAMQQELDRSMEGLAAQPEPPYFLAFEVVDNHNIEMHGEDGAFGSHSESRMRQFDVDVRVGDPSLDNTHPAMDLDDVGSGRRRNVYQLPIDDDPDAIRVALWQETERRYRNAVSRLIQVKANKVVRLDEGSLGDFSDEEPSVWLGEVAELQVDRAEWEQRLRDVSAVFRDSQVIYDGSVRLSAGASNRYFLSSEGTKLRIPRVHYRVSISVATLAPEGTELDLYHAWDAAEESGLPNVEEMIAKAEELERMLVALTEATPAEPFSGPAILSGRASAVFFHEIFGHRMEGHRLRDEGEGQTFGDEVGEQILPTILSVVDDPTLERAAGQDLNGYYPYDNEGIASERVVLVDDGVLRSFLTSRTPIPGQAHSNGHGRRQAAHDVISRQGNLMVECDEPVSHERLRELLVEQIEAQDAPYGLLFDDITGGFTYTGRSMANAFNVSPVVVYRVYADGRPDELVRGADLIGTPLATFAQVLAADDEVQVFNGHCGAESGWVPVSAVSPALLVRQIEVQRKETGDERPPVLAPPVPEAQGEVGR